jgi:hypothetical protein
MRDFVTKSPYYSGRAFSNALTHVTTVIFLPANSFCKNLARTETNRSSRRREDPIFRHVNGLGTNKNSVMAIEGLRSQGRLCWRGQAAIYWTELDYAGTVLSHGIQSDSFRQGEIIIQQLLSILKEINLVS